MDPNPPPIFPSPICPTFFFSPALDIFLASFSSRSRSFFSSLVSFPLPLRNGRDDAVPWAGELGTEVDLTGADGMGIPEEGWVNGVEALVKDGEEESAVTDGWREDVVEADRLEGEWDGPGVVADEEESKNGFSA